MKKQIAILACLLLFYQPLIARGSERYVFINENVDGKFFLDMETISYIRNQEKYRVWCKVVPSEAFLEGLKKFGEMAEASHALMFYEINAPMRMMKTAAITVYAANGKVINTKTFNMDWEPIIPNSIFENVFDAVLRITKEAPGLIKIVK